MGKANGIVEFNYALIDFLPVDLAISYREVLSFPTVTVDLSILPCCSINFSFLFLRGGGEGVILLAKGLSSLEKFSHALYTRVIPQFLFQYALQSHS